MKKNFLVGLMISLVLNEGFAECPSCPPKAIKREVGSEKKVKEKEVKRAPASRLQKKVIRKEPAITSAKMPFPRRLP